VDTIAVTFELGFRQIEAASVLWRVVPFEALDQPPGFGGRKGFVERGSAVDVEIVLDENDRSGVGEVAIGQLFQDVSVVHGGMAIGDFVPSGPLRPYSGRTFTGWIAPAWPGAPRVKLKHLYPAI
jgi:hypothetical protein